MSGLCAFSMGDFAIDKDALNTVNAEKDSAGWATLGGVDAVTSALKTDRKNGLASANVERNRVAFGANTFKEVPPKSFFSILLEALKDPTLILLMVAATVSTILGTAIEEEREENAWVEGVAIWVAVILVSLVGSVNDYQKELQFRKLNAEKDLINIKVIRDGKEQLVPNTDIVVGDVMVLDTGDKVIADGVEIEGHNLIIDEASLTGESDPIKKMPDGDFWCRSGSQVPLSPLHQTLSDFCVTPPLASWYTSRYPELPDDVHAATRTSTHVGSDCAAHHSKRMQVTDGDARVLVTAVGVNSEWGMIMDKVQTEEDSETPLQEKLGAHASPQPGHWPLYAGGRRVGHVGSAHRAGITGTRVQASSRARLQRSAPPLPSQRSPSRPSAGWSRTRASRSTRSTTTGRCSSSCMPSPSSSSPSPRGCRSR